MDSKKEQESKMIQEQGFSSLEKDIVLCRRDLDEPRMPGVPVQLPEKFGDIVFFQIKGITEFWKVEQDFSMDAAVGDILSSFVVRNSKFLFAIIGNVFGINIYIGGQRGVAELLEGAYEASFPGIEMIPCNDNPLSKAPCRFGGMFTGIPTDKLSGEKKSGQIDSICRGMAGRDFTYVILATGLNTLQIAFAHSRVLEEMSATFSKITRSVSGGAQGNMSAEIQDLQAKNYYDDLEILASSLKEGTSRGMWRVNGYYGAANPNDGLKLGGLIKASFSGTESRPQPFRLTPYMQISDIITNMFQVSELIPNPAVHPIGKWEDPRAGRIELCMYKYQTLMTSDQLSVMCRLPRREFAGFYVDKYVEFDVSARSQERMKQPVFLGSVTQAGRIDSIKIRTPYCLEKKDFTRHGLIIGITGGGKTNTSKSILDGLWNKQGPQDRVPFLVIESAKREYWELRNIRGFENLLVFTLGAEDTASSVRYRINPFETLSEISLQTHIDYLLSTFKAAFELYPPMPYVLESAVYAVYRDRGWDIVENRNMYGLTEYPTLSDLYNKIDVVVSQLGYDKEVQNNVRAALQARINSLMIGGKGAMMNTPKSIPISTLLSRPVIMELEDLGDDDTKSFVIGVLMVQLYEYRKSRMTKGSKDLQHILMIEEAHRLLKNVPEGGDGSRAKSVEFFCNMLAEIRTFGQGILIADQIPTKLAPDTIKNTNLKIVHRTVAMEDREAIGRSMSMTSEQIEYLSSLRRGYAAVYSEGDNEPMCVKFPLVTEDYNYDRDHVIREVRQKLYSIVSDYDSFVNHHCACSYCDKRCRYKDSVESFVKERLNVDIVLKKFQNRNYRPSTIKAFLESNIIKTLEFDDDTKKRCLVGYILSFSDELTNGEKQQVIADYMKHIHSK